ncbi:MAG: gamma carbonic anhydrase family protein [Deltaproteobacteria bacterium]|nr:gamma carbonic anhydrase family protein [Deltaproteobacteria bacterium]
MALYRFGDRKPQVAKGAWVSDSARVIGDVVIGSDCYIGHGAVLRGDYGSIRLGPGTAVEENATIHIRPEGLSVLGERVTVGHGAILHCNRIDDCAVIGMGAVLSFGVEVGEWAIVAEGCVVPGEMKIPKEKIVKGVPAKVTGEVNQQHKEFWNYGKQLYIDLAAQYPKEFERID